VCGFAGAAAVIGGITALAMRMLRLLPLTFVCGVHGFAFFAPYLVCFLAAAHLLKRKRSPMLVPARMPVNLPVRT
jgi:hypothetical protein